MKKVGIMAGLLMGLPLIAGAQTAPPAPTCESQLQVVRAYRAAMTVQYERDLAFLNDELVKAKARIEELERSLKKPETK